MALLLDSVILIDHFNGVTEATQYILENHNQISTSVITRAEVLAGFDNKKQFDVAKQLLDRFPILPLMQGDADLAAEYRQKYKIKLPDAFQAALARNRQLKLVTRNTKDFIKKRFDFVIVPYKL